MEAYPDGTYSILAFYGVDGYNLDFKIDTANEKDMFSFVNGEYVVVASYYETWQIPTGLSSPSELIAYPWSNYSYMTGDQSEGEVGIGTYYGENFEWGYDIFTWPVEDSGYTVDDLVGVYNNHCYGWDSINDTWEWVEFDATDWEATIEKVSDYTISVDGIYWLECPVVGTVNFQEMTVTFSPQDYYDGYVFASNETISTPVEGYINADMSITIPDFALWYDFGGGECYTYLEASCDLTKKSAEGRPSRRMAPQQKVAPQKSTPSKPQTKGLSIKPQKKSVKNGSNRR